MSCTHGGVDAESKNLDKLIDNLDGIFNNMVHDTGNKNSKDGMQPSMRPWHRPWHEIEFTLDILPDIETSTQVG